MSKRIEQSRRHGHSDPRWADLIRTIGEHSPAENEPERSPGPFPPLRLVGGTDTAPDLDETGRELRG
jgi:hypothetical protein